MGLPNPSDLVTSYFRVVQRNQIEDVKKIVESLKESGDYSNKNVVDILRVIKSGNTALHICATFGYMDLIRYLVDIEQADLEQINLEGKTALHDAAQFSQPEAVRYLISRGANVNVVKKADWTPLMLACTKQNVEVVDLLISGGASLNFTNKDGWTCLHIAAREGNADILGLLLKSCPDSIKRSSLTERKSRNGRKAVHTAVMHGHLNAVKMLARACTQIELNEEDTCGSTPLMDACRCGHVEIVHFLVDVVGVDPAVSNRKGVGLLHVAAETNQGTLIRNLVDNYNLNVNARSDLLSFTPLHWAAREGNLAAIKVLIDLGADSSITDAKGKTPEDIARECERYEVAKYFEEMG